VSGVLEIEEVPTVQHLRVLRNIEAGRYELAGFAIEENGMRSFFQCVLCGWVDRGKLTDKGRAELAKASAAGQVTS
jgi:hypothetical protein